MTTLAEKRDQAMDIAKFMKTKSVESCTVPRVNSGPEMDLLPTIQGFRGDDAVVVLMTADIDRDDALHAARICAVVFGCDAVTMVTEGWHPSPEHGLINPVTGKEWERGEMQDVVENHDGLTRGWLTEGLTCTAANAAGDSTGAVQDYVIHEDNGPDGVTHTIEWKEPFLPDDVVFGGYVVESLVSFMNDPNVYHSMAKTGVTGESFGLTAEEAQAHQDCAAVKFLTSSGFRGSALLMAESEARRRIIDRSLGTSGLI